MRLSPHPTDHPPSHYPKHPKLNNFLQAHNTLAQQFDDSSNTQIKYRTLTEQINLYNTKPVEYVKAKKRNSKEERLKDNETEEGFLRGLMKMFEGVKNYEEKAEAEAMSGRRKSNRSITKQEIQKGIPKSLFVNPPNENNQRPKSQKNHSEHSAKTRKWKNNHNKEKTPETFSISRFIDHMPLDRRVKANFEKDYQEMKYWRDRKWEKVKRQKQKNKNLQAKVNKLKETAQDIYGIIFENSGEKLTKLEEEQKYGQFYIKNRQKVIPKKTMTKYRCKQTELSPFDSENHQEFWERGETCEQENRFSSQDPLLTPISSSKQGYRKFQFTEAQQNQFIGKEKGWEDGSVPAKLLGQRTGYRTVSACQAAYRKRKIKVFQSVYIRV